MNGRIGTDLEYAVRHKLTANLIPAGVLPIRGTKGNPEPLAFGGVEIDCCAVETTPNPATNEDDFVKNILGTLEEIKQRYPEHTFVTKPSHYFDKRLLMRTPQAMVMGCSPDFNAWTGQMNQKPNPPDGLRSFGGHVHVEGGEVQTIKAMDLVLGMWSVIHDSDTERRKIYGKAGAYRNKPYGVEYRVLSNFWCDDEKLIRDVFNLTRHSQSITGIKLLDLIEATGGDYTVQSIINTSNVVEASRVFEVAMAA